VGNGLPPRLGAAVESEAGNRKPEPRDHVVDDDCHCPQPNPAIALGQPTGDPEDAEANRPDEYTGKIAGEWVTATMAMSVTALRPI